MYLYLKVYIKRLQNIASNTLHGIFLLGFMFEDSSNFKNGTFFVETWMNFFSGFLFS